MSMFAFQTLNKLDIFELAEALAVFAHRELVITVTSTAENTFFIPFELSSELHT